MRLKLEFVLDIDPVAWAREYGMDPDNEDEITADAATYYETWLRGTYPVDVELAEVVSVKEVKRKKKS